MNFAFLHVLRAEAMTALSGLSFQSCYQANSFERQGQCLPLKREGSFIVMQFNNKESISL